MKKKDCVESIVSKYSDTVYKLAFARMRNKQDADDVFQEVFLSYIKNAPEFDSDEHEKAWFIRVTLNCCKDIWRSSQRCDDIPLQECEDVCAQDADEKRLEFALAQLDVADRSLIHLYYYEGYSCKDLAQMLGKSSAAVRMRLSRVRKVLKKYIEEDSEDA